MDGLGGKFWLALIGIAIAIGLACGALLLLIGGAWYTWGFLGTIALIGGIAIAIGYIQDRRNRDDSSPVGN